MPGERIDVEALLEHRPFVRRLARSLVRDDARADDIVQETWIAALRNPPRSAGAVRAWLASVVRKLAWTHRRSEERRAHRERKAPRPGGVRSPEEAVERAHWHRRVVDAVMELEEPYRTTILLRYFEELTSEEIGRLQEVPAATVRTRVRRGLEQLRRRFDDETKGGRRAWATALLPLALEAEPPRPDLFAAKWKAAAAGLAIATGGLIAVLAAHRPSPAPERTSAPSGHGSPTPWDPWKSIEEGEVPLRRADGLALEVRTLAAGSPAEGVAVALARAEDHPWRWTPNTPWEPWKRATTDREGEATFVGLSEGFFRIVALAPGHGRASTVVHLPLEIPHAVVLELPEEVPREVVVVDRAASGAAVAGARVELWERTLHPWVPMPAIPPTDAKGRTRLAGVGVDEEFRIRVTCVGYAPFGPVSVRVPGDLRVELEPRDRSRDWALTGPIPNETVVTVRRINERVGSEGRVLDGLLRVEGLERGVLLERIAVATGGRFARLDPEEATAEFVEPPRLELFVRDAEGRPAAGFVVRLFDPETQHPVYPDGVTGGGGRARFPVYASGPLEVRIREGAFGAFRTVGRYEPSGGDGSLALAVPTAHEVTLRVLLDGVPGLPGSYRLYRGRTRIALREQERDEARGILRFRVRPEAPGDPVFVHLLAAGHLPGSVRVDASGTHEVDLEIAGTLEVRIARWGGSEETHLELLDGNGGAAAIRRGPWRFRLYPGPDGVLRETMMPPGRYRVRETVSGTASEAFAVPPGSLRVRIYLDPARERDAERPSEVRGTITAYRDLDLRSARVVATGPTGEPRSFEVARDGSFVLPWPGEGPLRLRVLHPSAPGTEATVTAPREDLVLRLSPTHVARVRVSPAPEPRVGPGETPPRVVVFPERGPPLELDASLEEEGILGFSGFRAGPSRIWIDLPGFAPKEIGHVVLREGINDLGAVALDRGSLLVFRLAGEERPELVVAAQALDAPRYQRSARTQGEASAILAGLGAGAFRVTVWERSTGHRIWSRRLELDGVSPADFDLELP